MDAIDTKSKAFLSIANPASAAGKKADANGDASSAFASFLSGGLTSTVGARSLDKGFENMLGHRFDANRDTGTDDAMDRAPRETASVRDEPAPREPVREEARYDDPASQPAETHDDAYDASEQRHDAPQANANMTTPNNNHEQWQGEHTGERTAQTNTQSGDNGEQQNTGGQQTAETQTSQNTDPANTGNDVQLETATGAEKTVDPAVLKATQAASDTPEVAAVVTVNTVETKDTTAKAGKTASESTVANIQATQPQGKSGQHTNQDKANVTPEALVAKPELAANEGARASKATAQTAQGGHVATGQHQAQGQSQSQTQTQAQNNTSAQATSQTQSNANAQAATQAQAQSSALAAQQAADLSRRLGGDQRINITVNVDTEAEAVTSQPRGSLVSQSTLGAEMASQAKPNGVAQANVGASAIVAAAQQASQQAGQTPNGGQNVAQTAQQVAAATTDGAATAKAGGPVMTSPPLPGGETTSSATAHSSNATTQTQQNTPAQTAANARPFAPQQPPTEQVTVQLSKALANGNNKINIQLRPAELGRVDIQLEVTHDGRIAAVVSADNKDTLDMLQKDARTLERALQNAGLQTDEGSLSFNLRGDGERATPESGNGNNALAGNEITDPDFDEESLESLLSMDFDAYEEMEAQGRIDIRA